MTRILSAVKALVVADESSPRRIAMGPFSGIRMNMNLAHQTQMFLGLFERETHPWLKRFSEDVKTAIDIGAAHGEYTLFFLTRTNASHVYAFEPDTIMLSHLKSNLDLNPVADAERRLTLRTELVGSQNSKGATCLDTAVQQIALPCFIKMDVDGAEVDVLSGATRINSLPGVRWLIETHSAELEAMCIDRLKRDGFQTRIIKNAWWRCILPEQRPIAHNRWLAAWK